MAELKKNSSRSKSKSRLTAATLANYFGTGCEVACMVRGMQASLVLGIRMMRRDQ